MALNNSIPLPPQTQGGDVGKFVQMLAITSVETTLTLVLQVVVGIILVHPKVNMLSGPINKGIAQILLRALLPMFVCLKFGTAIDFHLMTQIISAPIAGFLICALQLAIGLILFMDCTRCAKCIKGRFGQGDDAEVPLTAEEALADVASPHVAELGGPAPHLVEVEEEGFDGVEEEPLIEKKEKATLPRNILIMAIQFNNYLIIPYAYLTAFTKSNVFVDPEKELHAIAFVTLCYFPIMVLFFSFGNWYASQDPVAKEMAKAKEIADAAMKERMERREEAFLDMGESMERERHLGWRPPEQRADQSCGQRVGEWWQTNYVKCECIPEGVRKVLLCLRGVISQLMQPVIIGMLIGVFIGLIPPLKAFFFTEPPPVVVTISKMLKMFSGSVFPLALLVTGANIGRMLFSGMVKPPDGKDPSRSPAKFEALHDRLETNPDESLQEALYFVERDFRLQHGPKEEEEVAKPSCLARVIKLIAPKTVSCWVLVRVVGAKLLLSPAIVFLFLLLISKTAPGLLVKEVLLRPIMYLTIAVEASCPVTLGLAMYAAVNGVGVQELSECMLWQYFLFPLTMIPLCVVYLYYFCSCDPTACYRF